MKLSIVLAAITTGIALAAPVTETISKRADVWAYLCTDRGFTGHCAHIPSAPSQCVPLASDLNDLVSSVGPDEGFFCYFFVDPGCKGDFFHVGSPGYGNLAVVPVNGPAGSTRNFEDKLSSYFCVNL